MTTAAFVAAMAALATKTRSVGLAVAGLVMHRLNGRRVCLVLVLAVTTSQLQPAAAARPGRLSGGQVPESNASLGRAGLDGLVRRAASIDSPEEALRLDRSGLLGVTPDDSKKQLIDRQLLKLSEARKLLRASKDRQANPSGHSIFDLGRQGLASHARIMGVDLPATRSLKTQDLSASEGALAIIELYDANPTKEQKQAILDLDQLPAPVERALGQYLSSFLAFDDAVRLAYKDLDPDKLEQLPPQAAGQPPSDSGMGATAETAGLFKKTVAGIMGELGIRHLDRLLGYRLQLLDAAETLASALQENPVSGLAVGKKGSYPTSGFNNAVPPPEDSPAEPAGKSAADADLPVPLPSVPAPIPPGGDLPGTPVPPADVPVPTAPIEMRLAAHNQTHSGECEVGVAPALCINLSSSNNDDSPGGLAAYRANYALQIDSGGNDVYLNNAGGSNVLGPSTSTDWHCVSTTNSADRPVGSAALLDLAGDDKYQSGRPCGVNGGGNFGAGFLVDLGGKDLYMAERGGTNGGGSDGHGFLLDAAGDDTYLSDIPDVVPLGLSGGGSNGGAEGSAGSAFLLDGAGDDAYLAKDESANGGVSVGGNLGFLWDIEGSDLFAARAVPRPGCLGDRGGTNGGFSNYCGNGRQGEGFLLDSQGNDAYLAGGNGTNGGNNGGFLLDQGGDDTYKSGNGHVNGGERGFLVDEAGDDNYIAGNQSANGAGAGFLFDGAGDDSFTAGDEYTNGGGLGLLVDRAGNDDYTAGDNQTNGGDGGRLIDRAGNDAYTAGDNQTNGGGVASRGGFLIDQAGNDKYSAGNDMTNGGGSGGHLFDRSGHDSYLAGDRDTNGGRGRLVDGGGNDTYRAGGNGTNGGYGFLGDAGGNDIYHDPLIPGGSAIDCSMVPKPPPPSTLPGVSPPLEPDSLFLWLFDFEFLDDLDAIRETLGLGAQLDYPHTDCIVRDLADVSLEQTDAPDPAHVGEELRYELRVTNNGPRNAQSPVPAEDVVVSDVLPEGVTYRSASSTRGSCDHNPIDRTVTCSLGALEPASTPATVTIVVIPERHGVFVNEASVQTASSDPDNQNNQASATTSVLDQGAPDQSVSIRDASVTEGDSGAVNARFTVELAAPSSRTVTVNFDTTDAEAVAPSDYEAQRGSVTFSPGETRRSIEVKVIGDDFDEPDETFFVRLGQPTRASIGRGRAVGVIRDDDAASLSVSDARVTEPDVGTSNAVFRVSLAEPPSEGRVSVDFRTTDRTALAGADYSSTRGRLEFAVGETVKSVPVPVMADELGEIEETFSLDLSGAQNAVIGLDRGVGRIVDNQEKGPSFHINDTTVVEGNSAVFTVTLSNGSQEPVSVDFSTADNTATAPGDYSTAQGTLRFPAGERFQFIRVPVVGDSLEEPNETFEVRLSHPVNSAVADPVAIGKILDDEGGLDRSDLPGGVFVSGHDAEDHAVIGQNREGAKHIVQGAVSYVTYGRPAPRILYVVGDTNQVRPNEAQDNAGAVIDNPAEAEPPGEAVAVEGGSGPKGMAASGFGSIELATAGGGLGFQDLKTTDFGGYDAVVVACRSGCALDQDSLDTLTNRRDDLVKFVNAGGGLVAFDEGASDDDGQLTNQFGFLPALVTATSYGQNETGYRVTPVGEAMGLASSDVNGNYSHNLFPFGCGYDPVDIDGAGRPVSIATRSGLSAEGCALDGDAGPSTDSGQDGPDERVRRDAAVLAPSTPSIFGQDPLPPEPARGALQQRSEQTVVQAPPQSAAGSQPQAQVQSAAQAEFQPELQSQSQAHSQRQAQPQSALQGQAAAVPLAEAAPGLEVRTERARDSQSKDNRRPTQRNEGHRASARLPAGSMPATAIGSVAALMAFMVTLCRPRRHHLPAGARLSGVSYRRAVVAKRTPSASKRRRE